MFLEAYGLLVLLGVIFAVMILVGRRWCGNGRPVKEVKGETSERPHGPAA